MDPGQFFAVFVFLTAISVSLIFIAINVNEISKKLDK